LENYAGQGHPPLKGGVTLYPCIIFSKKYLACIRKKIYNFTKKSKF